MGDKMIENPLTIKDVVKIAKQVLEETGQHNAQVIYEDGKGYSIGLLMFENDMEKEVMLRGMRQNFQEQKVEHYFVINEAWTIRFDPKNKPKEFIRPSKHKDRTECLVVSEHFKLDSRNNKTIIIPFHREGKKIIFEEEVESIGADSTSRWNFFLELDGVDERLDKEFGGKNGNKKTQNNQD